MTQAWIIRRAVPGDVWAMGEIENLSFPAPWSRWHFLTELTNPVSHTLVAGPAPPEPWEVRGYIIYWVAAQEMHIMNLAVQPQNRRRGLARFLLAEALKRARHLGAQMAWLEVRPSNTAALTLYHAFGFSQVGRRPRYYKETQEDALVLTYSWEEKV